MIVITSSCIHSHAPFLAEIELDLRLIDGIISAAASRLKLLCSAAAANTSASIPRLLELIAGYFARYGHKSCCFHDLAPYMDAVNRLASRDAKLPQTLLQALEKACPAVPAIPNDAKEVGELGYLHLLIGLCQLDGAAKQSATRALLSQISLHQLAWRLGLPTSLSHCKLSAGSADEKAADAEQAKLAVLAKHMHRLVAQHLAQAIELSISMCAVPVIHRCRHSEPGATRAQ